MVRAVVLGAAIWVGAVTLLWLVAPVAESTSVSVTSSGRTITTSTRESLLKSEGQSVTVLLSVPVALVAVAVAAQGTRWRRTARTASGGLLLFGALLGAMSVGLPYAPPGIALSLAGLRTQPPQRVSVVGADP